MQFLDSSLQPMNGPGEWKSAILDLELPLEAIADTVVRINGHELPVMARSLGDRIALTMDWPRTGPGRYTIESHHAGEIKSCVVAVPSAKLGEDRWWSMIHDLQDRLTASIAIGLQRLGGLEGMEILEADSVTLNAELTRIYQAIYGDGTRAGLVQIIPAVVRDPHTRLVAEDRMVPVHQARTIPPHLLHKSLRSLGENELPERVVDRRQMVTVNTYENQVVRLFLTTTVARLSRIRRQRSALRNNTSQVDALVTQLEAELSRLMRSASEWLNQIDDLARIPVTITMVIIKRPDYRAAMEGYLQLHRKIAVHNDISESEVSLNNTPMLYQQWGSLMVIDRLVALSAIHGWVYGQQNLLRRDSLGLILSWPTKGHTMLELRHEPTGRTVTVKSEPSYTSTGSLQSSSFEQRPDIVLEVRTPGSPIHLLVLDPKYKLDSEDQVPDTGKPLKVDIDKMHAYRDAIVLESGQRVVGHAAILYPGQNERFGKNISAIRCLPGTEIDEENLLDALLIAILSDAHLQPLTSEDGSGLGALGD